MPREIWNEGRVVGYSSYEIYVKQHLSEDPGTPPATEREWLASTISMGSSMILKVPNIVPAQTYGYLDVFLPSNSKLAAANTIVAQFFDGDAHFNGEWADRVTDYGSLISNTSTLSPSGEIGSQGSVYTGDWSAEWSAAKKAQLRDYMRICDGIMIQPGTWVDSENKPPQKDFHANLGSTYPRIRLRVKGSITSSPLILLTGFTLRSVLAGVTGTDTSTDTASPQDGDFLGPAVFPWAAKVVFSVPNSYIDYFASSNYDRTLKSPTAEASSGTQKQLRDTSVIDMQASKPETFYNNYTDYYAKFTPTSTNPRYAYTVNDFTSLGDVPDDGAAVLTVYQKKAIYPPALYGTFVGTTGEHYLNPVDVVAPGTVKMFYNQNESVLNEYQTTFPGTTGMNRLPDGTIQVLNSVNRVVSVAGLQIDRIANSGDNFVSPDQSRSGSARPTAIRVKTGQKSAWALMLSNDTLADGADVNPTLRNIDPKPSAANAIHLDASNSDDNIAWSALIEALQYNRPIDLLGNRLKSAKQTLIRPHGTTANQGPYIEFGPENDKLRLYISDEAPDPANVPLGSIGIGWGLES